MNQSPEIIRLLTEIKSSLDAVGGGGKYWVATIAAGSAIIGASIPAIIQYFNNINTLKNGLDKLKIEINADLISKQRQEWINAVRNTSKELLAEYNLVYNYSSGDIKKPEDAEFIKLFFEIRKKSYLLELYLNPKNPKHEKVITFLKEMNLAIHRYSREQSRANSNSYNDTHDKLMNALIEVINEAWGKIKKAHTTLA